jgi:sporulation protein YlmC with PRC-barrel domain
MRTLSRAALSAWLLLCLPLLMGMGGGDSEGPTRIPEPSADYRVRLTDQEGARVELTAFAIDGQTFVLGQVGQGQVAVPFERVKAVEMNSKGGQLKAKVALKDGEPVEMAVKAALKATGKTSYGNFRIPMGEVRAVEFLGMTR